jgi:hypothetical protein
MLWLIVGANVLVFIQQAVLSESAGERFLFVYGMIPRRLADPGWANHLGFPPGAALSFGRISDPLPQTGDGHEWHCVEMAGRGRTGGLLKFTVLPDCGFPKAPVRFVNGSGRFPR